MLPTYHATIVRARLFRLRFHPLWNGTLSDLLLLYRWGHERKHYHAFLRSVGATVRHPMSWGDWDLARLPNV